MDLRFYHPKKEKEVKSGEFTDGVFHRKFSSHHIMRNLGYAIGIQKEIVGQLEQLDCRAVHLSDGYHVYESKFSQWVSNKTIIRDFGYGVQHFVKLDDMTLRRKTNGDD